MLVYSWLFSAVKLTHHHHRKPNLLEAVAALRRIQKFLLLPESEEVPAASAEGAAIIVSLFLFGQRPADASHTRSIFDMSPTHPHSTITTAPNQADAELHYGSPEDFTLSVPEFSVAKGEVAAIVGRVGSGGRRGLLQLLLGVCGGLVTTNTATRQAPPTQQTCKPQTLKTNRQEQRAPGPAVKDDGGLRHRPRRRRRHRLRPPDAVGPEPQPARQHPLWAAV
jgi:hypothetical protein